MCHKFVPDSEYEVISGPYNYEDSLEITPSNIRIWIHERDLSSLERVLWEGYGSQLLSQTSTTTKIRKFLEAVPKLMNEIREVHEAAVVGDTDLISDREYRQPVYTAKDVNGLTAFHKAVGNGHRAVARHLMEKTDRVVMELTDKHGRQALHYAAGIAEEDGRAMYDWLLEYGADETKRDDLMHPPDFYFTHGSMIKYSQCSHIPDAPRIKSNQKGRSNSPSKKRSGDPGAVAAAAEVKELRKEKETFPPWDKITKDQVSKWIKTADLGKLEYAVYMGKGSYMKGKVAWNEDIRKFLQTVPNIVSSIHSFHEAVTAGDLSRVDRQISTDRKLIKSRDHVGRTALHKASQAGNVDLVDALLNGELSNAEDLAGATDKDGRSALHYAARCQNEDARNKIEEILTKAGASMDLKDFFGNVPSYYYENEFPRRSHIVGKQKNEDGEKIEDENDDDDNMDDEAEDQIADDLGQSKINLTKLDKEVAEAIEDRRWDRLVQFVLDGEGDRILEHKVQDDDEVQEFIDNVPAFQEKISLISRAVESGSLRDVQTLLDRKKFALARDRDTGMNFLQKAIILGHFDIARYLANNFPKVLDLADQKGRTSLHYAMLHQKQDDDDRIVNLLIEAGADQNFKDNNNLTPKQYLEEKDLTSLKEFKDLARKSFDNKKQRRTKRTAKEFKKQETSSDVQNTFDEAYETSDYEEYEEDKKSIGVDQRTFQKLDISFRRLAWARQSKSLLKRFLTKKVFDRLRHRKSEKSGTLLDIIQGGIENLDADIGVLATHPDAYKAFWPLFKPIVVTWHGVKDSTSQPAYSWEEAMKETNLSKIVAAKVKFVELDLRRNISGFPFQPKMTLEMYRNMEKEMVDVFERMEGIYSGLYHSYYDIPVNVKRYLSDLEATIDDNDDELKAARVYENFPVGRGVFVSQSKEIIIWLNESDHFRMRVRKSDGNIAEAIKLLKGCLEHLEEECMVNRHFCRDKHKLGFLTMSPAHVGTGLHLTIRIEVMAAGKEAMYETLEEYNLQATPVENQENVFDITNKFCFGISEDELIHSVILGVEAIPFL